MSKKITGNDLKKLIEQVMSETPKQRKRSIRKRKRSDDHGA